MTTLPFATPVERIVREVSNRVLSPKPPQRLHEWAAENRELAGDAVEPGKYDPFRTPYVITPLDLVHDRDVDRITLAWAGQTGKTEVELTACAEALHRGSSVVWVYPTETRAARIAKERIHPVLKRVESLAFPKDAGANHAVLPNGGVLAMPGSNQDDEARGRSSPLQLIDEITSSKFNAGIIDDLVQRGANFSSTLLMETSTVKLATDALWVSIEQSQLHTFHLPCPRCGQYQRLSFTMLVWDGGVDAGELRAYDTARLVCQSESCRQQEHGGVIRESDKPWMLTMGVWLAEGDGERIESDGRVLETRAGLPDSWNEKSLAAESRAAIRDGAGERLGVRIIDPAPVGRHVGFQLSALYSPWVKAKKIASEFVKARGRPTVEWWGSRMAEPKREKGLRVGRDELLSVVGREDDPSKGLWREGTVDPGVRAVIVAADVQLDRVYVEVRGWHARGSVVDFVEFIELPHEPGDGLKDFIAWLRAAAYSVVGAAGATMSPVRAFVDSGHSTDDVYGAAIETAGDPCPIVPIKGAGGSQIELGSKWTRFTRQADKRLPAGAGDLLVINTDRWKQHMYSRLVATVRRSRGLEDDTVDEVVGGDGAIWRYPLARDLSPGAESLYPGEYFSQLASEERVEVTKNGRTTLRWKIRAGVKDNHACDICVYGCAGAYALGIDTVGVAAGESRPSGVRTGRTVSGTRRDRNQRARERRRNRR